MTPERMAEINHVACRIVEALRPADPVSWEPNKLWVEMMLIKLDEQAQRRIEELETDRDIQRNQFMRERERAELAEAERDRLDNALVITDATNAALKEQVRVITEERDRLAQRVKELEDGKLTS